MGNKKCLYVGRMIKTPANWGYTPMKKWTIRPSQVKCIAKRFLTHIGKTIPQKIWNFTLEMHWKKQKQLTPKIQTTLLRQLKEVDWICMSCDVLYPCQYFSKLHWSNNQLTFCCFIKSDEFFTIYHVINSLYLRIELNWIWFMKWNEIDY